MEKKNLKWGWIIFWIVIFWPVGIYLLIKKLSSDKSALMSGMTSKLPVIAWCLIGFGVLGVIVSLTEPELGLTGVIIYLVFFVGGVLLLKKAKETKKIANRYKKYLNLVINQNIKSIDGIASAVGLSYDVVSNELEKMIDSGYLNNAYINQNNREIVLRQHDHEFYNQKSTQNQESAKRVTVRCPGCGANNVVVVDRVTECDYCATPIHA